MVFLNALKSLVSDLVHVLVIIFLCEIHHFISEKIICKYYIVIIFSLFSPFALYHFIILLSPIFVACYIHMFRADNGVLDSRSEGHTGET